MEYLIPIVLVILLVGGFVTFLVLNATKKSKPAEAEGHGAPTQMAATDEGSPLGDTTEHSGEQSEQGHTVSDPEGGGGESHAGGGTGVHPGEGEGAEHGTQEAPQPESEKLANRRMV